MKIMFTMMSMQKGGAERVIANISNFLISNNEIVLVPILNEKIEYKLDNNIKIRPINNKSEKRTKLRKVLSKISIIKLNKLKKIILDEHPDIIISFLPEPSFKVLMLKKFNSKIKNIPVIVSVRNDPKIEYNNIIINKVMRKLYVLAEGFVFQTEEAKEYFKDILNCKNRIIVNPVGDEFIRDRFKDEREKRIVSVGRLEPQKNQILLIEAFAEVNKLHPEYILELYGAGSKENELKQKVNEMKLNKVILFKGKSDDIHNAIYNAKAFVMTSNYEGMPNALLEAFVLGVPCISTDCPCGGPRHIISNNKNGILVEMNNKKQLVNAILKIIETNIGKKFSENANGLRNEYKIEKICQKWNDFIREIGE